MATSILAVLKLISGFDENSSYSRCGLYVVAAADGPSAYF
jgi:hypothetical protein